MDQQELTSKVLFKNKKLQKATMDRSMLRDFKKNFTTEALKKKYIYPLPSEDEAMYNYKIHTYEVFNVVKRTIEILAAKPFQSDATIDTEDEFLKTLKDNFDGYGTSMTRFLMQVFSVGLWDTQAHIFVDNKPDATILDQPVLTLLNNDNILDVNYKTGEVKKIKFTEIFEKDTEFSTEERKRTKLYIKKNGVVRYSIFEENDQGEMIAVIRNERYKLDHIPLVSFNPMDFENPFLPDSLIFDPMARVNKQMIQKDCDLNNIVSIICFPLLLGSGFDATDKDVKRQMKIGPNNMILIDNEKANLKYVEHTGAAVNTSFKYISSLIQRMNTLGFEMLTTQTGNITATSKAIDAAGNNSMIANFAINLTNTAEKIVREIMSWKQINKETYFSIDLKTDYSIKTNAEDMNALINAHQSGAITNRQYVFEMKRRGIVDDNLIYDDSNENNIENITYE